MICDWHKDEHLLHWLHRWKMSARKKETNADKNGEWRILYKGRQVNVPFKHVYPGIVSCIWNSSSWRAEGGSWLRPGWDTYREHASAKAKGDMTTDGSLKTKGKHGILLIWDVGKRRRENWVLLLSGELEALTKSTLTKIQLTYKVCQGMHCKKINKMQNLASIA